MKKLKFYLVGLIPGIIIMFFILNKKGAGCSGYLPNGRVIAETESKKFSYSDEVKSEMSLLKIDEKFLKDSIITLGKIDFDKSHAQQEPCPDYFLTSPKKNPKFEIRFTKCKEEVTFTELKKLR